MDGDGKSAPGFVGERLPGLEGAGMGEGLKAAEGEEGEGAGQGGRHYVVGRKEASRVSRCGSFSEDVSCGRQ